MFAVLKLLSFLPFGSLLRGGTMKIVGILGLVAVLAFGYWKWKDSIEDKVRDSINADLLKERIEEQERQTQLLLDVSKRQDEIIRQAIERNQALRKSLEQAQITIGAMEATPATPPLEATMEILRQLEAQGVKVDPPQADAPEGKTGNRWIDAWKKSTGGS